MTTYFQSKEDGYKARKWLVVDASGIPLGRLASQVASLIRGKHKPTFTPHVDGGDFVIVINAKNVRLTGNKKEDKIYYQHSGYLGGMKSHSAGEMLEKSPERLIETAVKGMLPKGPLGHQMATKLKVYAGEEHLHAAQNPTVHTIANV